MPQPVTQSEALSLTRHTNTQTFRKELIQAVSKYAQPSYRQAFRQIANTLLPYLGLWTLLILTVLYDFPYWLTLLLTVPASGFLVRIFILFHDCCHGAFLPSRAANKVLGYMLGIMAFTPFEEWRRTHIIHHANSGNLDSRGVGDIWTMTVDEYLSASPGKRLAYRLFRNPLVLFSIVPLALFLVIQRFPGRGAKKRERTSVIFTNLAIAAIIVSMGFSIGFQNYLLIQLPIILLASVVGMWLFYIQHQYADAYWERRQDWDLISSGLAGSSYYKLPNVLQWLVGNIGLHHIHHIRANIPNYNLQRCQKEAPLLQIVKPLTLRKSLKSLWLNLWDEQKHKLVSFQAIRSLPRLRKL
ncbi:MAG: fatty acid desaturase [Methylomonas sp.]|jgi:omega-6 fatty acid desaturase (delta-12 desaturase)